MSRDTTELQSTNSPENKLYDGLPKCHSFVFMLTCASGFLWVFLPLSLSFLSRCIVVLSWRSLAFFPSSILTHTLTFLFIRTELVMREWVWAFIFIMYWGRFGCCFLLACSFFISFHLHLSFSFKEVLLLLVFVRSASLVFQTSYRLVHNTLWIAPV